MSEEIKDSEEELQDLVRAKIENLRPKLLDLSRRNPLISTKFSPRSNTHFRVVDELPDALSFYLGDQQKMRFVPLPPLEEDPKDEQSREFQGALANARLTDEVYLGAIDEIDPSGEAALDLNSKLERELKDRVRESLSMPPHRVSGEISLPQHARNNDISPSFELPDPSEEKEDGRFTDSDIQTLLLPRDLERKLNALMTKCRTWVQETGINVLHAAYGFLEWTEPGGRVSSFAPLVLAEVEISKKKTRGGLEFWVKGSGEEGETNAVLAEKLRIEFGIDMPKFEGGSIEEYLKEVSDISPKSFQWKVRRQVAFGVFPSARMAMYHDLDTTKNSFSQNEAISQILGGTGAGGAVPFADEYEVDQPEIEKKVPFLVLDADSSQFSTLVDVADGKNLAVEGPPGTGKSQTIVNAIAAALADGKKVLFVAEKMAALDVVKSRLEAVGLGEFLLPLQAERSTRARVMESIRARIEIVTESPSSDYQLKIEKFRQIRSELASYIDAISCQLGNTGFTVFEILGKSIASNNVLEGYPRVFQTPDIHDLENYNNVRIETLLELGASVKKSWSAAEVAEPYWRGHNILNIDRFTVENICSQAEIGATAYLTAAEARQELVPFGIDPEITPPARAQLETALRVLVSVSGGVDAQLVGRVCRGEKLKTLTDFRDNCRRFQTEQDDLSRSVVDTLDETTGDHIRLVEDLCSEYGLDTIDPEILGTRRGKEIEGLARSERTRENLEPFVEVFPESANFSTEMLRKAGELVAATSREILSLRSERTADPVATGVVSHAKRVGEELLERRSQLETVMLITQDTSNTELAALAAAIGGSGPFSAIFPAYRLAKRTARALSRRDTFEKETATKDIRSLIDWKEAEGKFCSDQQAATVFGLHFKGIDTEFEKFDQLMSYYEAVEQGFPGTANREIRKFLKTGGLDLLQSIPHLDEGAGDMTFVDLTESIKRSEADISRFDIISQKLSPLTHVFKNTAEVPVSSLRGLAERMDKHSSRKAALTADVASEFLGDRFKGPSTELAGLATDIVAAEAVLSLDEKSNVALKIFEENTLGESLSVIERTISKDEMAKTELEEVGKLTGIDISSLLASNAHVEVAEFLRAASLDKDGLHVHSRYAVARTKIDKSGFDWTVKSLLQADMPLDDLERVIEAVIIRALAMEVYRQFGGTLSQYSGTRLDELRARLASLDKEIIRMSRSHLRARVCKSGKPLGGVGRGKKSEWTEMALIDNELSKKKRLIPVRDLTDRAGKSLLELKPCWMMSPLAVAQYLPKGKLAFDLCIIDEASQMPPEDSIGALARSRQAMVVGDTNQLPPTNFFRKMVDDDEIDEDEAVLNESILEMANATFRPNRRLRWHYRSRHSALIKFSSHMVYNDELIVFPSASESRPDMGVSLIEAKGRYRSGTNGEEAAVMVDAAIKFMKTNPERSLGLVTMNQKQRDLLLEEMEYAISRDNAASRYVDRWAEAEDGLEYFFIKNLENVQGDERDVIFIGTVYGPEQIGGPVMQRFGPVNGLAGKRRLNVLFSRAKEQIVTFSSMTAADIRADENSNPGVYMLKRWLEYSTTGILHSGEQTHKEPDSDFELFVMNQIRAMGCEPVPQIGVKGYFIDIGVKHPEWPHGFIMAVECDGATYHSSKSARERDRLRQEVLEGLGWFFHRVWSTDWFNDPHKEAGILREAISARLKNLKDEAADFSAPVAEEETSKEPVVTTQAAVAGYEAAELFDDEVSPDTTKIVPPLALDDSSDCFISIGDTIRVRYLTGTQTVLEVRLSDEINAPEKGIIHFKEPLGRALLGAEEGDEIEVLVGSYVREAIVESVTKQEFHTSSEPKSTRHPEDVRTIVGTLSHPTKGNGGEAPQSDLFDASLPPSISKAEPQLSPERFYEPEYLGVIEEYGTDLIDRIGPITFRHLSEKLARAHGFQRTGSKIKKQVWAAISKERQSDRAPNGETIFWPSGIQPTKSVPFRGLTVDHEERTWRDIPYPEKLGLAESFVSRALDGDMAGAMASEIGLGRLKQKTREELTTLLDTARELNNS